MRVPWLPCVALVFSLPAQQRPSSPLAPTAPPPTLSFAGTCRGHDPQAKEPVRVSLWLHDYNRDSATLVGDVRGGADGSFRFDGAPRLSGMDWGHAFYVVLARQGARIGIQQVRGDEAATQPVAIELQPGVELRGTVADQQGKPVAGATVRLQGLLRPAPPPQGPGEAGALHHFLFFAETPPPWTTVTRADGTFAIAGVVPGWTCSVTADADRLVRGRIDQEPGAAFDFALGPGAVLEGRVLLAGGRPAVRARVCAQGNQKHQWATTTTGDDGRYRFGSLAADAYNVWCDIEDRTCVALDSVVVAAGQTTAGEDLVAIAGGFLIGCVLDAATGKPLQPGVASDVAIYGPSRPRSGAGCAISPVQADGTFRIRVAPGSNHIYVRPGPGFEAVAPAAHDVEVGDGAEVKVGFQVRRAAGG